MKQIFFLIIGYIFSSTFAFAERIETFTQDEIPPDLPVRNVENVGLIQLLSYVTSFLLKVLLPLVIVGVSLYIAYELLTADGNEEKMKKTWKAVTYSAIGIICILLAYAVISIVSRLSF